MTASTTTDRAYAEPRNQGETKPARASLSLAVLALGLFVSVSSTTSVSVALPAMGRDLHLSESGQGWIVESFVLVYASLMMTGGALGDWLGRKGLFLTGAALFGIGSVVAGLAPDLPVLLIGRVIQGTGPALLVTVCLTIIRALFTEPARRAAAIGLWSTSSGVAIALGPVIGGALTSYLGWRWVLLMNGPIIAVLIALAVAILPKLPTAPSATRFDVPGAVLIGVSIATLAYGLNEGSSSSWTSSRVVAAAAVFVAAGAAFVFRELRTPEPLAELRLFRSPTYTAANLAGLVVFMAFIGAIVYLSVYFQRVQGKSPIATGLELCTIGGAFAIAAALSGRLISKVGPLPPMLIGLSLAGAGMTLLVRLNLDTGLSGIWWPFAMAGFGVGLSLTPGTDLAVSAVDQNHAGMASAINTTVRQVGQLLGVAVLGAIVYAHAPSGPSLDAAGKRELVSGLHHAVVVAGIGLFAVAALVAGLFALDARSIRRSKTSTLT